MSFVDAFAWIVFVLLATIMICQCRARGAIGAAG